MSYRLVSPAGDVEWLTRGSDLPRAADGRPLVPDDMLDALGRVVTLERAWSVLQREGYLQQYEGGFEATQPDRLLIGRALTASFLPSRPDFDSIVAAEGSAVGFESGIGGQNSWVLDLLGHRDVLVVDMFGRVQDGPFVGDLLTTTLAARTKAGAVIDGTIRDAPAVGRVPDVTVLHRGTHPSFIRGVTLASVNVPVRIGHATVLPGDIVVGGRFGVIFIPPHLVASVVEHATHVSLRDTFAKTRLAEGRYGPGRVDRQVWDDEIEADFATWTAAHGS